MNPDYPGDTEKNAVQTVFYVEVHEVIEGRRTVWPVTCPDDCEQLKGVKPISRVKATRFALDHLNLEHNGLGQLKVHRSKGDKRRGR